MIVVAFGIKFFEEKHIFGKAVFAYRHGLFVRKEEYESGRNTVPFFSEFEGNQLSVAYQFFYSGVVIEVHFV